MVEEERLAVRLQRLYAKLLGELLRHRKPPKRLSRLIRDREQLEHSALERAERIARLEAVLPHVAELNKFLEPGWDPSLVKPIRPNNSADADGLPPQGIFASAFEVLRGAREPLTIAEIVRQMATTHHLDISTVASRQRYHTTINNGIKHNMRYFNRLEGDPDKFELIGEFMLAEDRDDY